VYYTHVHNDLRESLDHVLVSEQFYDNSRRRLWLFDGLSINNDHLNEDATARPARATTASCGWTSRGDPPRPRGPDSVTAHGARSQDRPPSR
jgi:hypothetical protein